MAENMEIIFNQILIFARVRKLSDPTLKNENYGNCSP